MSYLYVHIVAFYFPPFVMSQWTSRKTLWLKLHAVLTVPCRLARLAVQSRLPRLTRHGTCLHSVRPTPARRPTELRPEALAGLCRRSRAETLRASWLFDCLLPPCASSSWQESIASQPPPGLHLHTDCGPLMTKRRKRWMTHRCSFLFFLLLCVDSGKKVVFSFLFWLCSWFVIHPRDTV